MTITTKAALAAELGVTRARVSQYVTRGLPVRSDGKIDREEALNWLVKHERPAASGNKGVRRAANIVREQSPPRLPRRWRGAVGGGFEPEVAFAIRLVAEVGAIAGRLAVEAGAPLKVAYVLNSTVSSALDDVACRFLTREGFKGFGEGLTVLELAGRDVPEPDWQALAAKAGEPFDEDALEAHLEATLFPPGWKPKSS